MAERESVPEFAVTAEQQDLRVGVRRFLAQHCDEATVRGLMDTDAGHDPVTWARLGGELGVLGLAVPEELGGAGGGLVDQAVVAEECGAALLPGPLLGTVGLAVPVLVSLGAADLLGPLLEGTRTAALAVPERGGRFVPEAVSVNESDGRLRGELTQVVDGGADVLVVAARSSGSGAGIGGLGLYTVQGGDRRVLSTLDQTRRQVAVTLSDEPGRLLATGVDAERALVGALRVGAALLAAEQVGGAQRLLDLTVAYAGQRLQFGRPIGSFQAVKHRCADMLVLVEHARSTAYHAAWALQEGSSDGEQAVSVAQATCSEAYRRVALDAVQLLGGIGFTWEHPAHLYLKRAVTDAELLGSAAEHREHVAALVLDAAVPTRSLTVAAG